MPKFHHCDPTELSGETYEPPEVDLGDRSVIKIRNKATERYVLCDLSIDIQPTFSLL